MGAGAPDLLDQRRRLGARLAREAGAEERIDDHVRLAELGVSGLRVDDLYVLARLDEVARHDAPVAAVGAATADDRPALGAGVDLQRELRCPGARALHQLDVSWPASAARISSDV